MRVISNPFVLRGQPAPSQVSDVVDLEAMRVARDTIVSWPGYQPTPLRQLRGLAASVGIGGLWYKDEQPRFGLKSFKALGGAYAVYRLVSDYVREHAALTASPAVSDLLSGRYRDMIGRLTVTCGTDGNHGRSVAWGAQLFGCACVIFLPQGVSRNRQQQIESYGAATMRVDGNYDAAVRAAADAAARHERWVVVSDTSYEGYTDIPRHVMNGYTVMTAEILDYLPAFRGITHVILQGGVGGLAAAVAGHMWQVTGAARPIFIVVEPQAADCLLRSALAGKRVAVDGDLHTIMGGLSCGEPSLLAWEVVLRGVDFFATLADSAIPRAMRLLAEGNNGDPPIVSGESGAVGVAFVQQVARHPELMRELGLDARAQVLVFGTEGDTDPELYQRIIRHEPVAGHGTS